MPVKIRLARHGKKHSPYYHIVVSDSRSPRDGKYIEVLGKYNPNSNPATIELDHEKALSWLNKGAQPTDTMRAILSYKGVMFRKHLDRGIAKGLLTQEAAEAKFQQWMEAKNEKIEEKRKRILSGQSKEMEARMVEEAKKKEAIAEKVRIKNTPPPPPAEEPAAEENTAETPSVDAESSNEAPSASAEPSAEAETPATTE